MKRIKVKNKTAFAIIISVSILLFAVIVALIIHGNVTVKATEIKIESKKIPEAFSGFRIAHVSDLHNSEFGKDNEKLLEMIKEASPDIIVVTGDLIDSYHTNVDISANFLNKAADIAPCYYVRGNHERRIPEEYAELLSKIENENIHIMENERVTLEKDGEAVSLIGMDDYNYENSDLLPDLKALCDETEDYKIVLSHKPDFFEDYSESGADLVLCGHAHGGQFILPFIGGVLAPGQGWFPEYTEGLYRINETAMIVSRGLGNSIFPFRINNYPQLVIVELSGEK